MHSGARFTLISGGIVLLIGIVLAIVADSSAGGLDGDWVGEENDWNGREGTFTHTSAGESMYVFVPRDDAPRCEDFNFTITKVGGDEGFEHKYVHDPCTDDGDLPKGHGDDPSDYWHYGRIWGLEMGEAYLLEANSDVFLINGEWLDNKIGEVIGGWLGMLGGGGCACCGVLILLLGLTLALTMKEEDPTTYQIDQEGRVILNQGVKESSPIAPGSGGSDEEVAMTPDEWYKQT
ncbi:MAG TPA: hypothetical protein QF641_02450 [Candidatus Thalassarchaeaceae archaeon]|nr:hypothetical protein [Candidatus Thalassarchaeaceae archaeon]